MKNNRVSFYFDDQLIDATILEEHVRSGFIAFTDLSDNRFKIIASEDYDYKQYLQLYNELKRQLGS